MRFILNVSIDSLHTISHSLQKYRLLFNVNNSQGSVVVAGAVDTLTISSVVSFVHSCSLKVLTLHELKQRDGITSSKVVVLAVRIDIVRPF